MSAGICLWNSWSWYAILIYVRLLYWKYNNLTPNGVPFLGNVILYVLTSESKKGISDVSIVSYSNVVLRICCLFWSLDPGVVIPLGSL